ncbi:MAG: hypothetical protein NT001_06310 [Candidatus Woesearchaeota archaeon]|nr:hypothetical protein [Candidatus Woesearchaeota archaeon]
MDMTEEIEVIPQENQREPIFIDGNRENLFIPVYSGCLRTRRYSDMIERYLDCMKRFPDMKNAQIDFITHEIRGMPTQTVIEYDNLAYDFQKRVLLGNPDAPHDERVMKEEMKGIDAFVMGPINIIQDAWFGKEFQGEKAKIVSDEYLKYLVGNIDGKKILCFDYVYGDQAGLLLDKILREYATRVGSGKDIKKIGVYMFGRIGSLDPAFRRNSIAVPNFVMNEIDIKGGIRDPDSMRSPVMNLVLLGDNGLFMNNRGEFKERYGVENVLLGTNLNSLSVAKQERADLRAARDLGCSMVEMEVLETILAIKRARYRYADSLDVDFGGVFYVSDRPLEGDTLEKELDSDQGAMKALDIIKQNILRS